MQHTKQDPATPHDQQDHIQKVAEELEAHKDQRTA